LTDLLLLVKVQFRAKLAHRLEQVPLSGIQPRKSPEGRGSNLLFFNELT
jgi:hypothetical protein